MALSVERSAAKSTAASHRKKTNEDYDDWDCDRGDWDFDEKDEEDEE